MAALHPQAQDIIDLFRSGQHLSITKVVRGATSSTDTVNLPEGIISSAHVTSLRDTTTDTALTIDSVAAVSSTDGTQGWTVTVSSGTAGATYYIIAIHTGNAAGL